MGHIRNQLLLDAIAKRVKVLREERGLTQETVYLDTQIHLARIETGRINIRITTLEVICSYFKISLADFFSQLEPY
jgi:transcriptional regulator with XRE-family HTH domain